MRLPRFRLRDYQITQLPDRAIRLTRLPASITRLPNYPITRSQDCLRFSVREEVRIDERVDHHLVGGVDRLEPDAHAEAAIVPCHVALGVDVPLGSRHAEPDHDPGSAVEGARRPDR